MAQSGAHDSGFPNWKILMCRDTVRRSCLDGVIDVLLIAVNHHYIRQSFDSPHPAIFGITPGQFRAQLEVLGSIGNFVSAENIRRALKGDPLHERSIVVTFDDGLREQYENAWPILRQMGIPAIFFVNTAPIIESKVLTVHQIHLLRSCLAPREFLDVLHRTATSLQIDMGMKVDDDRVRIQYHYDDLETARIKYLLNFQLNWIDREQLIGTCFREAFDDRESEISRDLYMDVEQISELHRFGCLGSHSHDHLPLGLLAEQEVTEQISLACSSLERCVGCAPFAMSYPYGSKEACLLKVGEIAREQGIEFAFTMERAGNRTLDHPLHLSRIDNNDAPGGKASKWSPAHFFDAIPSSAWYSNS